MKKALAERMLGAEMEAHLAGPRERQAGNHRNTSSPPAERGERLR